MNKMTPALYLQARMKLDQEYRKRLRSLDDVWALFHDSAPPPQLIQSHADAENEIKVRGAWMQLVKEVAAETTETFTSADIEEAIIEKHQTVTIERAPLSNYLKKLAEEGFLKIIEQGRGRRATIYKYEGK
jgi:hypothetical protein